MVGLGRIVRGSSVSLFTVGIIIPLDPAALSSLLTTLSIELGLGLTLLPTMTCENAVVAVSKSVAMYIFFSCQFSFSIYKKVSLSFILKLTPVPTFNPVSA